MELFHLQEEALEATIASIMLRANLPEAGGVVSFEGRVRNHHEGRGVLSLRYSAYPELALNEGRQIVREARESFGLVEAAALHRYGALAVGEMAVWVCTWGRHRQEAFEGARYLIDQIKLRLPIWKEEFYSDGSRAWVQCQH